MKSVEENLKLLAAHLRSHLPTSPIAWDFALLIIIVENVLDLSPEENSALSTYIIENKITAEKLLKAYP